MTNQLVLSLAVDVWQEAIIWDGEPLGTLLHVSDPGLIGAPSLDSSLFLCWLSSPTPLLSSTRVLSNFRTIYSEVNTIGAH